MGNCTSSTRKATTDNGTEQAPLPKILTANEKLCLACCQNLNRESRLDNLGHFFTPTAIVNFVDSEAEMTFVEFTQSVDQMTQSFPDLSFAWGDELATEIEPGKVIVKGFQGRGTHTGEPYGFGPYPPIPPQGKRFADPPLDLHFTIVGDKISALRIDGFGKPCGPPGAYEQVGGILF